MVHTKGSQNPSDFLSRHTTLREPKREKKMAEDYVNLLCLHAVPKAMTMTELQEATKADPTLCELMPVVRSGKWYEAKSEELKQFAKVKDDLTVNAESNLILCGSRIVIPTSLQQRAIDIAHEGHQGMVKTKRLLREKVWFPRIEEKVKKTIEGCIACQANSPFSPPVPLQMTTLPPKPWHTVNVDFCGPFPTGEYLLVVIDAYSRFPEVEIMHSTAGKGTIAKLDRIFSTHGIPKVLKSDNGPPFFSEEFKAYVQEKGIKHRKSTPLWPQGNAEVENFMKPLTKAVRSAHAEGRNWKSFLYQFLLNYRATPHSTTGIAPAQLLFNRKITTKLPEISQPEDTSTDTAVRVRDAKAKNKMKKRADKRARSCQLNIKIGDTVLVRQKKKDKFTTKFDPAPYKVIEVKGSMVTAIRNDKSITRNVCHFKQIHPSVRAPEAEDSDVSDDETSDPENSPQQPPRQDQQPLRRYPERLRRRCQRFGQNVYDT